MKDNVLSGTFDLARDGDLNALKHLRAEGPLDPNFRRDHQRKPRPPLEAQCSRAVAMLAMVAHATAFVSAALASI